MFSSELSHIHPLSAVSTEETSVVTFLYDDVGDSWLIFLLKADTSFTYGQQLVVQNLEGKT